MTSTQSFEAIRFGLTPGRDAKFTTALSALERYEAEGFLIATQFQDLKDDLNRVLEESWKTLICERFTHAGQYAKLDEKEREFSWKLSPQLHVVRSYLKAAQKLKVDTSYRTAVINFLDAAAPLADRVAALKEKVGKRPAKPTKEQLRLEAEGMTCQCCGRRILAQTGEIAHHGYQRPGDGYQTASCYGARSLPFEVSREKLGELIRFLGNKSNDLRRARLEIRTGVGRVTWSYYELQKGGRVVGRYPHTVRVLNEEELEAAWNETADIRDPRTVKPVFADLKKAALNGLESRIHNLGVDTKLRLTLFEGWTQTHRAGDTSKGEDVWVKL